MRYGEEYDCLSMSKDEFFDDLNRYLPDGGSYTSLQVVHRKATREVNCDSSENLFQGICSSVSVYVDSDIPDYEVMDHIIERVKKHLSIDSEFYQNIVLVLHET